MNWQQALILAAALAAAVILFVFGQAVAATTVLGATLPAIRAMTVATRAVDTAMVATAVADQANTVAVSSKRIARDAHEAATSALSQSQSIKIGDQE